MKGDGPLGGAALQLNVDTEIRYHDNDRLEPGFEQSYPNLHDYVEQVGRINGLLTKDGLTLAAQVDEAAFFLNRYTLDGEMMNSWELYREDDYEMLSPNRIVRLEKLSAEQRWSSAAVMVGDTYASFGRGIALNIVKKTDIDVDTSIQGGRLTLSQGNLELVAVSGLSNTQEVSQDNPNLSIARDPRHMVSGARLTHYALGPAQVGAHGVIYSFGAPDQADLPGGLRYEEERDAAVAGLSVELPSVLGLDWFAEGDLFQYQSEDLGAQAGEPLLGHAVYGSASAYPGRFTVLVEGKQTLNTERVNAITTAEGWEVANVPSLEYERVITEDSSAALNSNDLSGARLRVDWAPQGATGWQSYLSAAAFRDEEVGGLHFNQSPETIVHPVLGLQKLGTDTVLQLNAGYRIDQRDESSEGQDSLAHLDAELHLPVVPGFSVELAVGARQFSWGVNEVQQEDFLEMENALGLHFGEKWLVLLYQDYTNNPLILSTGNITDEIYGAGELQVHAGHGLTMKAFYGAYKAGIRCSGGQCRSLPGFEGGRLALQGVF
jgi:hypothetical protein